MNDATGVKRGPIHRGWGVWSLVLHRAKKTLAMIRPMTIKLIGGWTRKVDDL